MIFPFQMNWRTSLKPQTLSLANAVNTGITYSTPSRAMENSKVWAAAGFRGLGGYGPMMTFPGSGLDGMGCGCGCNGGGGVTNIVLYVLAGLGAWSLLEPVLERRSYGE